MSSLFKKTTIGWVLVLEACSHSEGRVRLSWCYPSHRSSHPKFGKPGRFRKSKDVSQAKSAMLSHVTVCALPALISTTRKACSWPRTRWGTEQLTSCPSPSLSKYRWQSNIVLRRPSPGWLCTGVPNRRWDRKLYAEKVARVRHTSRSPQVHMSKLHLAQQKQREQERWGYSSVNQTKSRIQA